MIKRHYVLFLLIFLNNNVAHTCGFYPYGESTRYNLLSPRMVYPSSNDWFFYTSEPFSNSDYDFDPNSREQYEENIQLWISTFNSEFGVEEIYDGVYQASISELKNSRSPNKFIVALNKESNLAYRDYLIFAKTCATYNFNRYDYWEQESKSSVKNRKKALTKALKLAGKAKTDILKRRYAHLAIRLAYYAEDDKKVNDIYDEYFKTDQYIDAIDYWALHFKLQFEGNSARKNVEVAMVFLNSKEKRFAVHQLYNWEEDISQTLEAAKTDEERIAVHYINACLSDDAALDEMQAIAALNEKHPCLNFLALREINKLENWILTPYYTRFEPSAKNSWYSYSNNEIQGRLVEDLVYARRVARFLKDHRNDLNHGTLYASYARFLSRDFEGLSVELKKQLDKEESVELTQFRNELYSLVLVANDEDPNLENSVLQKTLLDKDVRKNNQILLAISKELEFQNHKNLAALVLSHVNEGSYEWDSKYVQWKTDNGHSSLHADYYYDYFTYLDVMYSVQDVQNLIFFLDNEPRTTEFDTWLCSRVQSESTRLYDLVGTMYMRKNDLKKALSAFEQVNDTLWTSGSYAYKDYIHDDPFSNDFYGKADYRHNEEIKQQYTKPQIVKELLKQLEIVNSATGNKKAKAAYRAANCYRNMSFYGNAWMMRRYYWTISGTQTGLEDDDEYFHCSLAQKYYKIAEENTTSRDFKVLSLRMRGLCENYALSYEVDPYYRSYSQEEAIAKLNTCYKRLRKEYGNDYAYVISNCESYQTLFESVK